MCRQAQPHVVPMVLRSRKSEPKSYDMQRTCDTPNPVCRLLPAATARAGSHAPLVARPHLVLHLRCELDRREVDGRHIRVLGHFEEPHPALIVPDSERFELDTVHVVGEEAAVACARKERERGPGARPTRAAPTRARASQARRARASAGRRPRALCQTEQPTGALEEGGGLRA